MRAEGLSNYGNCQTFGRLPSFGQQSCLFDIRATVKSLIVLA